MSVAKLSVQLDYTLRVLQYVIFRNIPPTLKTMTYCETRQHKHHSTSSSILSLWLQKMHFKKHQDFLYQTKKNKIDFQQQYKNSLDVQKKSWTSRKFVCVCIFFFSLLLTFKTASFFLATRFAYDEKKPKGGQEGIGG